MGAENSKGQQQQQGRSRGSTSRSTPMGAGPGSTLSLNDSGSPRYADPNASLRENSASGPPTGSPKLRESKPQPLQPSFGSPNASRAGGYGGDGPQASAPVALASSVPRYVDQHSMVFTVPDGGGGSMCSRGLGESSNALAGAGSSSEFPVSSAPRSLQQQQQQQTRASVSGHDFFLSSPVAPLSPTRRHAAPLRAEAVSTPIAIPTYNSTADDAGVCGSPMLKSYRQHSMSASKNTFSRDFMVSTSPSSPKLVFSGSNPGAFSIGGTQGNVSDLMGSPPVLTSVSSHSGLLDKGKDAGSGGLPIHQRYLEITGYPLGLENYGNTCYCNSVIQLLYHCTPLRLRLLELQELYHSKKGGVGFEENTLLYHLSSIMAVMHKSNNRKKDAKKRELIAPSALLKAVREKNITFNNNMQQDAHEFAMYILNDIMETESKMMTDPKNRALFMEEKRRGGSGFAFWRSSKHHTTNNSSIAAAPDDSVASLPSPKFDTASADGASHRRSSKTTKKKDVPAVPELSPLQAILQGQYGSLTACLECGSISARDEVFIDLSLETRQGTSLLRCMHHFGDPEYFYGNNKLRCDHCGGPARAAKTIHVQHLPEYALLVHLKRFRYDVARQTFTKKADHVALPMTMDVEEYSTDPDELGSDSNLNSSTAGRNASTASNAMSRQSADPDAFKPMDDATRRKLRGVARHKARFTLTGFVAHLGEGPNLGHYFTVVRYGPQLWRRFDDDNVSVMTEREVEQYFGVPIDLAGVVTTTAYILLYERAA